MDDTRSERKFALWQSPESVLQSEDAKTATPIAHVIGPTRSVETNLGKDLPFTFCCNSLLDDKLTLVVVEFHPHGLHRLPNKLEVI